MKRFYSFRSEIKVKKFFIVVLVIVFDVVVFNLFGNSLSDNISHMTKVKIEELNKYYLNKVIKSKLNVDTSDYIKINLVNNNIVSVDIDNNKTNKLLDSIITDLENIVKDIENGNINDYYNLEFLYGDNGIILLVPVGTLYNNTLLYDLGPKIPIKVSFLENINAYVDVDVIEYGINSSLVKLYINIELEQLIEMPIDKEKTVSKYNFLIASKLVNGKVPDFYNGINSNSSLVNKNVK